MQNCPDPHCHFKTNKPGGMDSHLKTNPHHQAGAKFREFKGHNANQNKKSPKNGGKGGEGARAK
ncbi:hypothetical protein HZA87_04660 [Candidatus Uhrbacteria bacterium]|nr:hypothetical protein [Candidatus Uhrbacteria bacterium]